MEEDILHIKKLYKETQGQNYDLDIIEKCMENTSKKFHIPSDEIYDAIRTTLIENFAGTLDFVDEPYDENNDDQAKNIVAFSEQEYLARDFSKLVTRRFPIFDKYSQLPYKFGNQKFWQINKSLKNKLPSLKELNWSNQTLSYSRINIIGKHLVECVIYELFKTGIFGKNMDIVDATANLGTDSITFAMEKFVRSVKAYEILPNVYDMLVRNIDLYGFNHKIAAYNKRFDYIVPQNSLVIIDPPYEAGNNANNFNLSIDAMPIYYVAQKILDKGAKAVLLSMPKKYTYNAKFAKDMKQHVSVYQMGRVNNKMYLVMREDDAKNINLINHNYTLVISDETVKLWNGQPDPYSCKTKSLM
jgi:hypothetical protein